MIYDATRVLRAGLPEPAQGTPLLPGPTFAAIYHLRGDSAGVPYRYGRDDNPTWTAFEGALTELEGGPAVVFSSGMAAVSAVFEYTLRPGDVLVMPTDSYYRARRLALDHLAVRGVEVRGYPTATGPLAEQLVGARLLWLESPSNPTLEIVDIAALSRQAHEVSALVAVDNTTATCLGQQPLALGADFSVASDTKALTGHSDLVLGHVATRLDTHADALRSCRSSAGSVPGPMETWLAHRSLATLELRLTRQSANALAIAERLAARSDVRDVRYPGLPVHPGHDLARRQMHYFGPIVSFTLPSQAHAERFLGAARLITEATSFGGVHTSAERRGRWGGDIVPEGFIRFSAGCEDIRDLLADVEQALDAVAGL